MKDLLIYGDSSRNAFGEWLGTYGIWISVALAGCVFVTVLILFFYTRMKANREGPGCPSHMATKAIKNEAALNALGGADNIVDHSLNGSRVILVLNDYSKVDHEALKGMGVDSIVKMSNKITLVVKGDASSFYKSLF